MPGKSGTDMKRLPVLSALPIACLGFLCLAVDSRAQAVAAAPEVVGRLASLSPGSIQGVVRDEKGAPLAGAVVSALGATTAFAVSERTGRFELRTLSPGPYLVRAHLTGFVASRGQIVDVHPSSRASSSIALHHLSTASPVLEAGLGSPGVAVGEPAGGGAG